MNAAIRLDKYQSCLEALYPIQVQGKVVQVVGLVVEAAGPACLLGAVCDIFTRENGRRLSAEAMGFRDQRVLFEEPHLAAAGHLHQDLPGLPGVLNGLRFLPALPDAFVGVSDASVDLFLAGR